MHSFSVALLVGTAKNKQWNQSLPCFNFYELLNVLSSHWFQSSGGNWGHSGIAGKLGLYTMYMLIAVSPLPCNFFTNQSFQSTSNLLLSQMPSACWYGVFFGTDTCICVAGWVGWYRKNGKILNQRKSSGNASFAHEMGPFLCFYGLSHIRMRQFPRRSGVVSLFLKRTLGVHRWDHSCVAQWVCLPCWMWAYAILRFSVIFSGRQVVVYFPQLT